MKYKKNWKSKILFTLLLFIISCNTFAKTKEVKKFEISEVPFLFRGKLLGFGPETYTPESFEKKYGKAFGYECYPPSEWYLSYDEGITIFFTGKDTFKSIGLSMEYFDEVTIFDCTIKKGETYKSIRKRLESANRLSCVTEYIKRGWRLKVNFMTTYGDFVAEIDCNAGEDGKVEDVNFFSPY